MKGVRTCPGWVTWQYLPHLTCGPVEQEGCLGVCALVGCCLWGMAEAWHYTGRLWGCKFVDFRAGVDGGQMLRVLPSPAYAHCPRSCR